MCKVCFVLGRVFDCLGQGLRHFWARLLTVLGRVCFDAIDLAHCLCLVGRCGGVFAGKVCALKSDRAHDVRRSCPKPSQTMPNGGEQGTEGGRLHGVKGCMGPRDAWGQGMGQSPRGQGTCRGHPPILTVRPAAASWARQWAWSSFEGAVRESASGL